MKLIVILTLICTSCCVKKEYTKHIKRFENAVSVITANKILLSKHKEFNKSGGDDFLFWGSRREFAEIVTSEGNKDLATVLALWDEKLIEDGEGSLWVLTNGNVYFQLNKCHKGYDYLVYDGGEEMQIDVSDDNVKERIKPSWVYIRMRE